MSWKALILVLLIPMALFGQEENTIDSSDSPIKVGVIGLVHSHVHWILGREDIGDIEIVGIAEPNIELAQRFAEMYNFSMDLVYRDVDEMLDSTNPEAVTVFTRISDHLDVVQKSAPRGIHMLMEKPLAVSLNHAKQMKKLADFHKVHLLTNYETTWYPTTQEILRMSRDSLFGDVRKIIVRDGHQGPKEIGVDREFLEWLVDPEFNGAGALTDFGCYGANLSTAIMGNQKPTSVTAITQQIKPEIYDKVDDEATIILTYPKSQAILQASWNWTFSRKDMEVYGLNAYSRTVDSNLMYLRENEQNPERILEPTSLETPFTDPFEYLASVVRGEVKVDSKDLSSLENNMIVMEILDAAMRSVREGRTIILR